MRRAAGRRAIAPQLAEGEARGCGGKRIYETFKVAAKLAKRQRRERHTTVEPYRCKVCQRYHIGEPQHRDGLPRISKSRPRQREIIRMSKAKPGKPCKPTGSKPKPKTGC